MKNLSLFRILSFFTETEIELFDKFLRSPYFNNQSTLVRFFRAVKKHHPDFDSAELFKEEIFRQVKPGKKFDDGLFRKYVSSLTKLAEEFLIQIGNETDIERNTRTLLEEFYRRKINKMYDKTLKKIDKGQSLSSEMSQDYFLNKHLLEEIKINYELMNEHTPLDSRYLFNSQFYIFNYFIMLTTVNLVELMNTIPPDKIISGNDIIAAFTRNFDYEKFVNELSHLPEEQLFVLKMNFLDMALVLKPNESKYYYEMKKLIREYSEKLSANALYLFLVKINNYCVHRVNAGENGFVSEIFDNFNFALHSEKYLTKLKQSFSFAEFRNALMFSLELHEVEWTKWLIENFTGLVKIKGRSSVKEFANAFLSFEQKDFEKSLNHVSKIEIINPIMKFDTNLLLTKLYYELNYFESCYSLIDSFRHLIDHNELMSDDIKKHYYNYLKHYKRLLEAKQKNKELDAGLEVKEIENEKMIKSASWLIEKARELHQ